MTHTADCLYACGPDCDCDCHLDEGDGTLGPCGCIDYHYADCPTRAGAHDDSPEPDDYEPDWGDEE